jgi:hypothetical protein
MRIGHRFGVMGASTRLVQTDDPSGCAVHYRLPEMLETIAEWLRHCAEYMLEQVTVSTEDGWSKVSVIVQELRPSDIVEQLTADGHAELATSIAALVKMHGVREGLRNAGIAYS